MNPNPLVKALVIVYMASGILPGLAQDSATVKPTRTASKTMVVNPKVQKPVNPAQRAGVAPVSAAQGATSTGTTLRRPTAGAYQQPAAGYTALPEAAITDKSLSGQYQYLLSKIYGYQRPVVAAFYKNITDSLVTQKRKIKELQASVASQSKAVKDLQTDVSAKDASLTASNSRADAISLLGIEMSKSSYNTLMWGLVLLFGVTAAVVILQSGSNRREARYRTKLYDDLDEEYKTYKTKANEKEKKLARELQTARNKLEDITGNPEY